MKITINQYEKSVNKYYSVATENVLDEAEYFTNKKEACQVCRQYKRDYPNYNHAVSLVVLNQKDESYDTAGDYILYL